MEEIGEPKAQSWTLQHPRYIPWTMELQTCNMAHPAQAIGSYRHAVPVLRSTSLRWQHRTSGQLTSPVPSFLCSLGRQGVQNCVRGEAVWVGGTGGDLCRQILWGPHIFSSKMAGIDMRKHISGYPGLQRWRGQMPPSLKVPLAAAWLLLEAVVAICLPCYPWHSGSSELGCTPY